MEEIKCEVAGQIVGKGYNDMIGRVYSAEGCSPTIRTCVGGNNEPKIIVPEATKKGYDEATYGDSINMAYPGSTTRRGRVGHGVAQTITTDGEQQAVVEPTIWGSKQANCAIKKDGICPTLTSAMGDGGGQVPMHNYDCLIRKLTPHECFKLMGVRTEDFEKVSQSQSDSSLWHLAGDSIVTTCLMSIFGSLLGVDYESKITELVEELKQS